MCRLYRKELADPGFSAPAAKTPRNVAFLHVQDTTPAMDSRIAMRLPIGGWVPNKFATPPSLSFSGIPRGSVMHRWAVPWVITGVGSWAEAILRSALARPSGFQVSSAPLASARYSRERETAKTSSWPKSGASTASIIHRRKRISISPPPPPESRESRRLERPPPQ